MVMLGHNGMCQPANDGFETIPEVFHAAEGALYHIITRSYMCLDKCIPLEHAIHGTSWRILPSVPDFQRVKMIQHKIVVARQVTQDVGEKSLDSAVIHRHLFGLKMYYTIAQLDQPAMERVAHQFFGHSRRRREITALRHTAGIFEEGSRVRQMLDHMPRYHQVEGLVPKGESICISNHKRPFGDNRATAFYIIFQVLLT